MMVKSKFINEFRDVRDYKKLRNLYNNYNYLRICCINSCCRQDNKVFIYDEYFF